MSYKRTFKGPTKAAILRSQTRGFVEVITPYNSDYLEAMKELIHPSYRKWDAVAKRWTFNELILNDLISILKIYFDEIETDLNEPAQQTQTSSANPFTAVLALIKNDDLDKTYKALAFSVHPDRGGTEASMKQLNEAYKIRKERK